MVAESEGSDGSDRLQLGGSGGSFGNKRKGGRVWGISVGAWPRATSANVSTTNLFQSRIISIEINLIVG